MEEELEQNEEQNEEVIDDMVTTYEVVPQSSNTIEVPAVADVDESTDIDSEDTNTFDGDEETATTDSAEDTSDDKWGSLDCRSECKYNTGDRSKYANYGYSD